MVGFDGHLSVEQPASHHNIVGLVTQPVVERKDGLVPRPDQITIMRTRSPERGRDYHRLLTIVLREDLTQA